MSYYTYLTKNIMELRDFDYPCYKIKLQVSSRDEDGEVITILFSLQRFISSDISITQERKVSLDLSGVALSVDAIWNFVVGLIGGRSKSFSRTIGILTSINEYLEIAALWLKNTAIWIEGITLGKLGGHVREALSFIFGAFSVILGGIAAIIHNKILSVIAVAFGITGLILGIGVSFIIKHYVELHSIIASIIGAVGLSIAIYTIFSEG